MHLAHETLFLVRSTTAARTSNPPAARVQHTSNTLLVLRITHALAMLGAQLRPRPSPAAYRLLHLQRYYALLALADAVDCASSLPVPSFGRSYVRM
jgi:hypothetical protein